MCIILGIFLGNEMWGGFLHNIFQKFEFVDLGLQYITWIIFFISAFILIIAKKNNSNPLRLIGKSLLVCIIAISLGVFISESFIIPSGATTVQDCEELVSLNYSRTSFGNSRIADCYINLAIERKDESYCRAISKDIKRYWRFLSRGFYNAPVQNKRSACYSGLAKATNNTKFCNKVTYQKEKCYESIR